MIAAEMGWGEDFWGEWSEWMDAAKRVAIAHGLHFAPELGAPNVWHITRREGEKIVELMRVSGCGAVYSYFCGYEAGYRMGDEHGYSVGMKS